MASPGKASEEPVSESLVSISTGKMLETRGDSLLSGGICFIYDLLISVFENIISISAEYVNKGICRIVDASVTTSRGEIFWNFFLAGNILSVLAHLNGERLRISILLDFCMKFRYNIFAIPRD